MKHCPKCGAEHEEQALFCRLDGTPLIAPGASQDPLVGQVLLGQFLVETVLGEGGMGTVYRAHQTSIDRKVAIKVLRHDVASLPGVAERFTREARLASRIKSPHVAHVYVTGALPDGSPMLAMEYLEGKSLDNLLTESAPLLLEHAVHIMRQVGEAAAEAHELGIVHRDLKPENVMLVRSGEDDEFVKVLDFGIAKQLGPDAASLTGVGVALGTPLYMSPEAAAGEEIGMPADVYALGVMFYQALSGTTPFTGDNPATVLVQHLQNAPPLLSSHEGAADVPSAIEKFVHRCLAKNAADRPQNGREFLHELERALAATPVSAAARQPEEVGVSTGPRRRRRGARSWIIGAIVGAIAALAVVTLWPAETSREAARTAELQRRADAAFAQRRYDGPGGAIALTDLLLTMNENDSAAIDLRRRMLHQLETDARAAEREGRLAAAIERLTLAERLAPDDTALPAWRRRLEGLLHAGEPAVEPAPPAPSPAPDVVAGAGDREVRVSIDPEAPVAGRPTTLRAILRGFPPGLERAHFHVRAASARRPALVDATKTDESTYSGVYEFPRAGRYVVAFAGHAPGSREHIDEAIQVNVLARAAHGGPAATPSPEQPSPTPTPTPEQPSPTPTPEPPSPTPEQPTPPPEQPTPPPEPTPTPTEQQPPTPTTDTPTTTTKGLAPGQPPPPIVRRRVR